MRLWRNAKGFTLPELLVALAIGSVLMLALAETQISVMRAGTRTNSRDTRLEAVRNGLDKVVEDLRLCGSPQALTNVQSTQSGGVTKYTGTAQPAGTAGAGLTATCPVGGSTSYTYAVVGGLLMRSDGVNPPTQMAANVDQMSFVVDSQGLITMTATTQPSAGNAVVVPTKVMPRVATITAPTPPASPPPPTSSPPACGLGQPAWQKHFFSATTPTFTSSPKVTGDLFADGNIVVPSSGSITGTGWATGTVSGPVGTPKPNQPVINQPTVDWATLKSDAQQSNTYLNFDVSDTYAYGAFTIPFSQPTLIYIDGNLSLSSYLIQIKGIVTLVVSGQVTIANSAGLSPADSNSAIAILGKNSISLSNTSQLYAVVYAQSNLTLANSAKVTGLGVAHQIQASSTSSLVQDLNLLNVTFPDFSKVCPG